MGMPKVSIIIPVYNSERTIKRCLDSIAVQTYPDFEVICIDDGSKDGSPRILDSFCQDNARFSVVHQQNAGAAAARNAGLDRARGEYVTFVDADDTLPKKALQFMHQSTVINECDTVMGMYERVDGMSSYTNSRSADLMNKTRRVQPDDLDIIHTWTLCNKWFSRKIIEENKLRLESFTHLEDATFLYKYLKHARKIYTCPHVIYTYYKPLPITGRTTTQNVDMQLLESAVRALSRLEALTSEYSDEFKTELRYRFLNSPLIGDYYRRFWKLDDACLMRVQEVARDLFAAIDDAHRAKIVESNFDILANEGVVAKGDILAHPLVAIAIGSGMSHRVATSFVEGLYDQTFVPFRLLLGRDFLDCVPDHLAGVENLQVVDGDPYEAARNSGAPYCAFVDCDIVYDHRSLMTMTRTLENDESLECVALAFGELDANGNAVPVVPGEADRQTVGPSSVLANKLFRTSAIQGIAFEELCTASSFECKEMTRPVVVRIVGEDEVAHRDELIARWEDEKQREERKKRNPLRRAKRKLGRMIRGEKPKKKTPPKRKTVDFFLDEEVDPYLIVIEGLGKRPKGNMLYILRELHKPEYAAYHIAFSITEDTRAETERIMAREGFEDVQLVVAGSDDYKLALFTAGYLFNEVDFPNWWIKKPGQIYTNTWHGSTLKTLGRAKKGYIHHDANASRNFTMADYLLFPNELTMKSLLVDCGVEKLVGGKGLWLGYPRTGILLDDEARPRIRKQLDLDAMQVMAWMPTYREWMTAEDATRFLGEMDELLDDKQVMYVNLHHKTGGKIDFGTYEHIRTFPDELDTYELLCAVDVLLTDYSSVLFDFAATGRNIVLYCSDLERYQSDRGVCMDVRSLPFPVVDTAKACFEACSAAPGYGETFNAEYNAYDTSENAGLLLRAVILGEECVTLEDCSKRRQPITIIVSDGLRPGPATDMLYELQRSGKWPENTYLSFLEEEVDKNLESAYPLLWEVPMYPTKGKRLSERTEEQRLYGDLPIKRVVLLDTESPERVESFSRFYVPVWLVLNESLSTVEEFGGKSFKTIVSRFTKWDNEVVLGVNAEGAVPTWMRELALVEFDDREGVGRLLI